MALYPCDMKSNTPLTSVLVSMDDGYLFLFIIYYQMNQRPCFFALLLTKNRKGYELEFLKKGVYTFLKTGNTHARYDLVTNHRQPRLLIHLGELIYTLL